MPYYSERSKRRLLTCHPDIQTVMSVVIRHVDITILKGLRGKKEQNRLYEQGKTKLKWPNSKHNRREFPEVPPYYERIQEGKRSHAVDIAPYPIDWEDHIRFREAGFYILGIADALYYRGVTSHRLRWGGDWNQNYSVEDESFLDLVHFELIM